VPAGTTGYNAAYIALAEALAAEIVTADEKLARAVREHTAVGLV
jgi:predicted nucleic acid-binding protein